MSFGEVYRHGDEGKLPTVGPGDVAGLRGIDLEFRVNVS